MSKAELELDLIGTPAIRHHGTVLNLGRKKSVALLAHAGVNNQPYTRDSLAIPLWPQGSGH